ncbi:Ig-like domain-containing protein, partial [Spongorhabdus nitratireducens]
PGNDFQDLQQGEQRTTEIEYTVTDEHGATSTAKLVITVNGVNDAPTAGDLDNQTHNDGDTVNIDLSDRFSDVDTSDKLTYSLADGSDALPQGLTLNAEGTITGTIDRNASQVNSGQYSITVRASDGQGGHVDQTFSWTVNNPAPEAGNDTAEIIENSASIDGNVITNSDKDAAPDSDPLTVVEVGAGNSNIGTVGGATTGSYGQLTLNSDGSYSYQLDNSNADVQKLSGPTETLTETFTYKVSDGNGGFDTATLTITIRGTNDAPIVETTLGNQSSTDGQSGVAVDISTGFSDYDQGDQLTFSAANLPPGLSINDQGLITGTLDPSASQGGTDGSYSVTITATDKQGLTVQQTFNWKVVNLDPQAADDAGQVTEDGGAQTGQRTSGNVIDNDADTAPDSDPLTIVDADTGNHSGQYGKLTLNQDGSYSYTLNNNHPAVQALAQGQTLTDRFSYTV